MNETENLKLVNVFGIGCDVFQNPPIFNTNRFSW